MSRRFWIAQSIAWAAYGLALMVPWIGTYTVSSMLPNKFVVAATGLAASSLLAFAYRAAMRRLVAPVPLMALVVFASLTAGAAWDATLAAILGGTHQFDLRHLGALGAGVPQLAGGLYHGLILMAWSLAFLVLRRPPPVPQPDVNAPAAFADPQLVAPRRIVLRDGKRAIVLGATEIDWVGAEGDYVRVHAGAKRLLIRATMAGMQDLLPAEEYTRIHRSTIVRLSHVRELVPRPNNEFDVVLRDGTKLRASRTWAATLRSALDPATAG